MSRVLVGCSYWCLLFIVRGGNTFRYNASWSLTVGKMTDFCCSSIEKQTRCVCETQMPPIMANTKDGVDHKGKYLDTSRKILSQEMLMCNMKALIFNI